MTVDDFVVDPTVAPFRECAVAACLRRRRRRDGVYCEVHQSRLRDARSRAEDLDEAEWRSTEPPVSRGGEISLRGLPPVLIVEVLYGLQQRCRVDGVKTKETSLRSFCNDLRRARLSTLADFALGDGRDGDYSALVGSVTIHVRRASASPETEIVADVWDLAVFGQRGALSFEAISQPWLRELAKKWATDDLPKRRSRTSRAGLTVRHHIGCLARLSESLRVRPDRGDLPAMLGRPDIDVFLNRLAFLTSDGRISLDARIRTCREVRAVLRRARALGAMGSHGPAAGLPHDFALGIDDVPAPPESGAGGRDIPAEILRQICEHLPTVASPTMRTGIELAIDTGRRPEEICSLAYGCLTRDSDDLPVLIYHNFKNNRLDRRLPIGGDTAALIVAQQQRVRARYPDTEIGELKLLPTDRRNPAGTKAVTAFSLAFAHRVWVAALPTLRTADDAEYDKKRVVLYAYRHCYAQRHADNGVGIDVLRELMGHRKLDTTSVYYDIGQDRRREAVDRVAALSYDRHGNRIWRQAQDILDSARARRAIAEVAVPYGLCTEPSNVKAGGSACPYRFRCVGCDHFRTDISYLPDLKAYLADLLRSREKLHAARTLDDWARNEATPSQDEIARIRQLIARLRDGLDALTPDERSELDHAIDAVRSRRTVHVGMPRLEPPSTRQITGPRP